MTSLLAITLPPIIDDHRAWWVAGAIIVIGLLIIGLNDVLRFSAMRTWAISSVCFAESYRKRILLITPLAIAGAIAVTQLQHPVDEADAIRQTVKFCLFAAGLVLVVTAIILACTNLPREIENRVIFTIVTKPTTRLEIVFGKIIGFARVSALILIVMGFFTWAYVRAREFSLQRSVAANAASGQLDPAVAAIYNHYKDEGLLQSRSLETANTFNVYSRIASPDSNVRYMGYAGDNDLIAPFDLRLNDLIPPGDTTGKPGMLGIAIGLHIGFQKNPTTTMKGQPNQLPIGIAAPDATPDATGPRSAHVQVQVLNQNAETLIGSDVIPGARDIEMKDPTGKQGVILRLPPEVCGELIRYLNNEETRRIYVHVTGLTTEAEYVVPDDAIKVIIPRVSQSEKPRGIDSPIDPATGKPALAIIRGRSSTEGQQIRGGEPGKAPIAVFRFNQADDVGSAKTANFEVRTSIEKSRDEDEDDAATTYLQAVVFNRKSGKTSDPVKVPVESHRMAFFGVPADAVTGGDFDVQVSSITNGHLVSFYPNSLQLVSSRGSFDINLVLSLLIMWLMSLLVITVAIFCSTFLSWPIAIVLTLLILLGHWGVQQLGDSLQPGIGPAMAQDMGLKNPATTRVLSQSVETLAKMLNLLSGVLPDISKFAATEDIERGVAISGQRLAESLGVLGGYALPMAVLSYVLLRRKEVAP